MGYLRWKTVAFFMPNNQGFNSNVFFHRIPLFYCWLHYRILGKMHSSQTPANNNKLSRQKSNNWNQKVLNVQQILTLILRITDLRESLQQNFNKVWAMIFKKRKLFRSRGQNSNEFFLEFYCHVSSKTMKFQERTRSSQTPG